MTEVTTILIACCLMISVILNIVVGLIGVFAWIELRSFMKSTHKVEFVPLDTDTPPALKKEIYRDQDLEEYGI